MKNRLLKIKHKANEKELFTVNYGGFDQNGKKGVILGSSNYEELYHKWKRHLLVWVNTKPIRIIECLIKF